MEIQDLVDKMTSGDRGMRWGTGDKGHWSRLLYILVIYSKLSVTTYIKNTSQHYCKYVAKTQFRYSII